MKNNTNLNWRETIKSNEISAQIFERQKEELFKT